MPISLPALNRRKFLGGTFAAGLGLMYARQIAAAESDPHRLFLLSDTHIPGDPKTTSRDTNMCDNFKQVTTEVLAAGCAQVLINGDCAFQTGEAADYTTFVGLLKPLREAGMAVHLTLGNHDQREHIWDAVKSDATSGREPGKPVEEKYAGVISTERANIFLLDSLHKTNSTPGTLGAKQLAWLGVELDAKKDKPALIFVHHHPVFANPNANSATEVNDKISGITDTVALWDVLAQRKQVKAVFFGHTHNWSATQREGIHLINLPAVAYTFAAGKANGWVDCKLAEKGAELTLHCIDKKHAQNGQQLKLDWRE